MVLAVGRREGERKRDKRKGRWGARGWENQLVVLFLSLFCRRMQTPSQALWVLCAEMGVAWHILGVGRVSAP